MEVAEDLFLRLFLSKLDKISVALNLASDEGLKEAYAALWREFDGKSDTDTLSFAVTDGSVASTTFRGGLRVAVARAITNVYRCNRLIDSVCDVDVRVGHRLRRTSLYMKALELKCLKKALEDHGEALIALYDGDLYPTIHPVLATPTDQGVEAYVEYLRAFSELYGFARQRGLTLIGITKDSFVNYLGAQILASLVSREDPEAGADLSRVRSAKNIMRKLPSLRDRLRNYEVYYNIVNRMSMSSDEDTLYEYTDKPGFTVPMALAPQPIFLSEEIKAGTKRWIDSKIRRRLLEANPPMSEVALTLDEIYELPPIAISYWRPWHGLGVYRVDVCGWALGLDVKSASMEADNILGGEAAERFKGIAALLNGLSPEPFSVKPLLDADDLVRFDVKTYKECYEPLIIEALRKAGFKVLLTKRNLRELMVRV